MGLWGGALAPIRLLTGYKARTSALTTRGWALTRRAPGASGAAPGRTEEQHERRGSTPHVLPGELLRLLKHSAPHRRRAQLPAAHAAVGAGDGRP